MYSNSKYHILCTHLITLWNKPCLMTWNIRKQSLCSMRKPMLNFIFLLFSHFSSPFTPLHFSIVIVDAELPFWKWLARGKKKKIGLVQIDYILIGIFWMEIMREVLFVKGIHLCSVVNTAFKWSAWCCSPYKTEVNAIFLQQCLDREKSKKKKKVHWFWE